MVKKNIGSVMAYRRVRSEVTKIDEILSTPILSAEQDAKLRDAAQMMIKKNIRRLLVKQDNKYVGIITQRDLQKLMTETIRALLIM